MFSVLDYPIMTSVELKHFEWNSIGFKTTLSLSLGMASILEAGKQLEESC